MLRFELTANLLIAAALFANLTGAALQRRGLLRSGRWTARLAWLLTAFLVAVNGLAAKGPPLGNMYQVLTVLSLCFLPLGALLARREAGMHHAAPLFCLLAALPLTGGFFMEKDALWRRMPALQSNWFIPHVMAYMIAYALALAALVFLAGKWLGRKNAGDFARRDAAAYSVLRFAFPFMTFGMLSGALWAERAWGQYWSWDPKETWSLIMWTFYLMALHLRKTPDWRHLADVAHLLGFIALLVTFLLVNLLPRLGSLLHGYA